MKTKPETCSTPRFLLWPGPSSPEYTQDEALEYLSAKMSHRITVQCGAAQREVCGVSRYGGSEVRMWFVTSYSRRASNGRRYRGSPAEALELAIRVVVREANKAAKGGSYEHEP